MQREIREAGFAVHDGAQYVSRIKLRDQQHFALESTEVVVRMFSEVMIAASRLVVAKRARRTEVETTRIAEAEAKYKADEREQQRRRVAAETAREAARESREKQNRITVERFRATVGRIWPGKIPTIQDPPFQERMPRNIPAIDDRFNKCKKHRIYACDGCDNVVCYSTSSKYKPGRARGEFQGCYDDQSWDRNVPGELLFPAYQDRLINCTWRCVQFCGALPTGVKDRVSRPAEWRLHNKYREGYYKFK